MRHDDRYQGARRQGASRSPPDRHLAAPPPAVTDAVLALDLSSSGVRARAHSRALTVVAERSLDIATRVGADGASCHDLEAIMAAVRQVVRPLAADPRLRIVALVASGTASSL